MNRIISLALLVGGIVLIVTGFNATNSFSSDISRFFTGSPTDRAVWMLMGGMLAALVGLAMLWRSPKHT
jgi:peptidoglycan/LPS O-acetylase OafA/YrhL